MFLIVEDEQPVARTVGRVLEPFGTSRYAESVAEALPLLDAAELQGLVLDIELPDGSGFDVLAAAREKGMQEIPALILTGHRDAVTLRRAQALGAQFLPKPPLRENLLAFARHAQSHLQHTRRRFESHLHELARKHKLSPRETELLRLVATGTPPKDVPDVMGISPNTAKTMTRRMLHKCDATRLTDITRPLQRQLLDGSERHSEA